ncbi:hypothetical protein B0T16DRAFT_491749 [Cercophora newfieldiana]|uniref:Uncharacterized protein n=1 Tax=Cercophora newfieldiana TaxID=92897 RepID=A0AA40CRX5_9PEZI|nr:hypothetical protein B0T16DRAFT_491749 [Cercophora newfieldiana]
MCKAGFATFACGHCIAIDYTRTLCEYARLKGIACPDFQTDKDYALCKTENQ